MDVFTRTFLPSTSDAGLPVPVVSRHLPVLRGCVAPEETTVLVATGHRPGAPAATTFLLVFTNRTLAVTKESRLLHRSQPYLLVPLRHLSHVTWTTDDRPHAVELVATVRGEVRERFWLPCRDTRRVRQVDALLSHLFRAEAVAPPALLPAVPRRSVPAAVA